MDCRWLLAFADVFCGTRIYSLRLGECRDMSGARPAQGGVAQSVRALDS